MVRKKRQDRKHIVYMLQNTVSGEFYIGVTQGCRQKDLRVRVLKHFQRALAESKTWTLCKNIRQYGPEVFFWTVLEVVRGKVPAHAVERELTKMYKPELNTQ
jgi:predicted GIY-YIG superfamily endonuclease